MKRKISLFSLAGIICVLISSCGVFWASYKNSEYGVSVSFPKDWVVETRGATKNVIFTAKSLQEDDADKFRENVVITAVSIPKVFSVEEFFELNKAELDRMLPGTKLDITESDVRFGGRPGKFFSFKMHLGPLFLRSENYLCVYKNRAYVANISCEEEKFKAYKPVFDRIIKSVKITD